ncbi:MAG: hypothetical protein ABSB23_17755 [Bryobacteraceae bacterium]|jgi:hypothetical protein
MTLKTSEGLTAVEHQTAEYEAEGQAIAAQSAELRQFDADDTAAAAEVTAAEKEVRRTDDRLNDCSAAEQDSAMRRWRQACQNKVSLDARRAKFPHTEASIAARIPVHARQGKLLTAAQKRVQQRELVRRRIIAGLEYEAAELAARDLEREAFAMWPEDDGELPKAGGLALTTMSPGTFYAAASAPGYTPKSVFEDDFLKIVSLAYPDLLELLPPERATAIRDKVKADYARGSMTFAGRPNWVITLIHPSQTGLQLARGLARRELRDL